MSTSFADPVPGHVAVGAMGNFPYWPVKSSWWSAASRIWWVAPSSPRHRRLRRRDFGVGEHKGHRIVQSCLDLGEYTAIFGYFSSFMISCSWGRTGDFGQDLVGLRIGYDVVGDTRTTSSFWTWGSILQRNCPR